MPQLDSLRALAVGLVFLSHWAVKSGIAGTLGVRLFFVLSGFLITSILLRLRSEIDAHGTPRVVQLRIFYLRRFLRLFPALILLVTVLSILDWGSIRHTWPWHVTYLSNIYFARRGEYEGPISPLWSLSVEEQFYLIWPLVVLTIPRKYLARAAIGLIGAAVVWRIGVYYDGNRPLFTHVLPFNWLDGLGLGALLSIALATEGRAAADRLSRAGRIVGLPLFVVLLASTLSHYLPLFSAVVFELAASLFFVYLVAEASIGFKGAIGRLLQLAPLIYLGRISYGLYLYHAFVPDAFKWSMKRAGVPLTAWDVPAPLFHALERFTGQYASKVTAFVMILVYLMIAIALASASWFLWEKRLNGLRRHVRYAGLRVRSRITTGATQPG